jgi:asparagine synthase (glutamine-hydrolysing)
MCGIAGITGRTTQMKERLERMSEAIAHRGPDNSACEFWRSSSGFECGFAHRRLSIIDLSEAGRQPMASTDGRYSITFNGEIYNYQELRADLEQQGVGFRTNSDTEVLLALYAAHREEALQYLRGMFAFAIRDNRTGEVFIARDRLGIKPLYYYSGDGVFLFSSEVRALLDSGLIERTIDARALDSYLSFGAIQEPHTIIDGIRSLPPAHWMLVSEQGQPREPRRYWRLPSAAPQMRYQDAIARTREILDESARLHLVADVPVAAFLSAGIDSNSIVGLTSRSSQNRVRTFTVCFDEQEYSEQSAARRVAAHWRTEHSEILLSEQQMLDWLPEATSNIDQPTIDGINTWVISRAVRQAGIKVALSGLGGDELFGGYPTFRRALKLQRYGSQLNWMGDGARRRLMKLAAGVTGKGLPVQKLASAVAAGSDSLSAYASMRGLFSKASRARLVTAAGRFDRSFGENRPAHDYALPEETRALIDGNGNGDLFNRISRYEMGLYMGNMLLRDTDAMSMASALEVRVPLLDHKLVEWVYSLPGEMKLGARPKQLLIDAMGGDLLPEIIGRKKMGFALPFDRWVRTSLRPFVNDALKDSEAVAAAGLNQAAALDVLAQFDRGSRATSWSRIWGLAVLVDWCRRYQVRVAD